MHSRTSEDLEIKEKVCDLIERFMATKTVQHNCAFFGNTVKRKPANRKYFGPAIRHRKNSVLKALQGAVAQIKISIGDTRQLDAGKLKKRQIKIQISSEYYETTPSEQIANKN